MTLNKSSSLHNRIMYSYTTHKQQQEGYTDVLETVQVLEKAAASHLHKLQQRSRSLEQYTSIIVEMLYRLQTLNSEPFFTNDVTVGKKREDAKNLTVVLTGDKGLVGGLWHELFEKHRPTAIGGDLLVIGQKGQSLWPQTQTGQISYHSFSERIPPLSEVVSLAERLTLDFQTGVYSSVSILYFHSTSLLSHSPTNATILPVKPPIQIDHNKSPVGLPIMEESTANLTAALLKKYLINRLYQFILETALTEFSTRTTGLEHAGAKTEKLIEETARQYRKQRRHADTQKQLERFAVIRSL